ncbi:MAG: hypothetical protein QM640_05530 [Niabella sp.]
MTRSLLTLLSLFFPGFLFAQYYNGRIRVDSADRSYIFKITDKKRSTSRFRYYYWFKSGRIHQSQGSYYGKLLNGAYKVVDRDRHLLEEGYFKKGRKAGLWRTWYESGRLKSTWRRRFWFIGSSYNIREYDSNGITTKSGYENKGRFTGSQVEWVNDTARIVRYKNGMALPDKTSTTAK